MAWTDAQIAELASVLDMISYPKQTIITSEAMATAVFHLVDQAKGGHDKLARFLRVRRDESVETKLDKFALVICDIGHGKLKSGHADLIYVLSVLLGTTDLASISIQEFEPYVRLSEVVSGQGSLCGSQRLTNIFVDFVRTRRCDVISTLSAQHNFSQPELAVALDAKFEDIKCSWVCDAPQHRVAVPIEYMDGDSKHVAELVIWFSQ